MLRPTSIVYGDEKRLSVSAEIGIATALSPEFRPSVPMKCAGL